MGTFSEGIDVVICLPSNCPAGQVAAMEGASAEAEGCTACAAGRYSKGAAATACLDMNCASGHYSDKLGSTEASDGCTECILGT